ncbi:MAG: HU family DNA-binding protein [Myxococcota bacterium]|nr:HU family DNA-binding protein [Myxococcota bacterium]
MTKSELIDRLCEQRNLPRSTAEMVVQAFVGELSDALAAGRRIELRGFGSFKVKAYDGYVGRNPRTGEPIDVAPKVLPLFKASRLLLGRMNPAEESSG